MVQEIRPQSTTEICRMSIHEPVGSFTIYTFTVRIAGRPFLHRLDVVVSGL